MAADEVEGTEAMTEEERSLWMQRMRHQRKSGGGRGASLATEEGSCKYIFVFIILFYQFGPGFNSDPLFVRM